MSIFIGIDPGKNGAAAAICGDFLEAAYLSGLGKQGADGLRHFLLCQLCVDESLVIAVEKVHATPQMGVTSAFTFGKGAGVIEGVLTGLDLPFSYVSPQRWQKAMNCRTAGDKNVTKAAAQKRFPQLKVTHLIADALLLACYAREFEDDLF